MEQPTAEDIDINDVVTLKNLPCFGIVKEILPIAKEDWGNRSQKAMVEWVAYSGPFPPPCKFQKLRDLVKLKPCNQDDNN